MEKLLQLDAQIFYLINHHRNIFFDYLFYFVSLIGEYAIIWWLVGFYILLVNRKEGRKIFLLLMTTIILTVLIDDVIIKQFIFRERPYMVLPQAFQVGKKWTLSSFPSGHAAATFGSYEILKKYYPKWKIPLLVYALLTLYSRPYLGMHYPFDVIAGAVIGFISAHLVYYLYKNTFFLNR